MTLDKHRNHAQGEPAPASRMSATDCVLLYLKGLAMGLGDSVPGVSGGTVAVITNIYARLIFAIRAVDLKACKLLIKGELPALWRHIDGTFLLILGVGILSGLLFSASTILFLLDNYFEALMGFFIGLVLSSVWLLKGESDFVLWRNVIALVIGFLLAFLLSRINPWIIEISFFYVFLSGMIAICAMILPGLSGAFILLLLGVYQYMLNALVEIELLNILVFFIGCIIGLLAFSRLLAWMLRFYHQLSYGFITGVLLGSVFSLWPWQQVVSSYLDSEGRPLPLQTINVLPLNYAEITGNDPMLMLTALSFLVGITVVMLLRWIAYRLILQK